MYDADAKGATVIETTSTALRRNLQDYLSRTQFDRERVTVTRNGKPVAAIIPLEDLELLQAVEDRLDLAEALDALHEGQDVGLTPWEQLKASGE